MDPNKSIIENIQEEIMAASKEVVSQGENDLYAAGQILAYANALNIVLEACLIGQEDGVETE